MLSAPSNYLKYIQLIHPCGPDRGDDTGRASANLARVVLDTETIYRAYIMFLQVHIATCPITINGTELRSNRQLIRVYFQNPFVII